MRLEIILILCLLLLGGTIYYKDGGFSNPFRNASSTPFNLNVIDRLFGNKDDDVEEIEDGGSDDDTLRASTAVVPPSISTPEIEKQVDDIYKRLDVLAAEEREKEIEGSASPYAGMFTLKAASAKATDPQKEYLTLTANSNNAASVKITGWKLESFVTNSKVTIGDGARLLESHNSRDDEAIYLNPGEVANLITGETPIRVSFRENECTGYLAEYGTFTPSLKKSCPMPSDELLQFSNVKTSDDECYEFVDKIKQCEIVDSDKINDADLSGSCESLIENVLNYEGCVDKHEDDQTFFEKGDWRIYLDRKGELWRSTREIIRLLDENNKVVATVEY